MIDRGILKRKIENKMKLHPGMPLKSIRTTVQITKQP